MNSQSMYSLAIQAIYERIDRLVAERNKKKAIKKCKKAIAFLEGRKTMDLFLSGFKKCPVEFHVVDRDCGNLPDADGVFEE